MWPRPISWDSRLLLLATQKVCLLQTNWHPSPVVRNWKSTSDINSPVVDTGKRRVVIVGCSLSCKSNSACDDGTWHPITDPWRPQHLLTLSWQPSFNNQLKTANMPTPHQRGVLANHFIGSWNSYVTPADSFDDTYTKSTVGLFNTTTEAREELNKRLDE